MDYLTLQVFDVDNGDCLLLESADAGHSAVDFCHLESLPDHPLCPSNQTKTAPIAFACLTHPHQDHMSSSDTMLHALKIVARRGGEFWHTVADMAELVDLYQRSVARRPAHMRSLRREATRLARIALMVAEHFPADRIRFISAEPGAPRRLLSHGGVSIDVLAPSTYDACELVRMMRRIANGELKSINNRKINRTSAVLRVQLGDNTLLLGGDAPGETWRQIVGRLDRGSPASLGVQCVKASHHGSADSFYPELWDDLFGDRAGIVLVSANGSTRPTESFLESFQPRRARDIEDEVLCTGILDPKKRPEFMDLQYQALLDSASIPVRGFERVKAGDITVTVPANGSIVTEQQSVRV